MKKYIIIAITLFFFQNINAQETDVDTSSCSIELDLGADVMSRYIWRGFDFGNSPSIQPFATLTMGNLEFGAWGAYATNNSNYQEADFYLTYSIHEMFSVTVTDYFFPDGNTTSNRYFRYDDKKGTGHIFEAGMSIGGTEKIPVSLYVGTNVYGDDAKNIDGDNMYSTYIELGYGGKIKETEYSAFIGGTPSKGAYSDDMNLINIGISASKNIKITDDYELPINCSVITNPNTENIFFVFGVSF